MPPQTLSWLPYLPTCTQVTTEAVSTSLVGIWALVFSSDESELYILESQHPGFIKGLVLCSPCASSSGGSGDPHLVFATGGKADFRGSNLDSYAFLSSPGYQVRSVAYWCVHVVCPCGMSECVAP